MKYFIDTEFIEGFRKPAFGKRSHFIDLVSIGIYAEDGRKYYAVSSEYNPKEADKWVKQNVLLPIAMSHVPEHTRRNMHTDKLLLIKHPGAKTNGKIASDIIAFVNAEPIDVRRFEGMAMLSNKAIENVRKGHVSPEFYGYYCDYDWVLFCSLFGRMIDLPKGFPMYCKDLKQMMDDQGLTEEWKRQHCPDPEGEHNALVDAEWNAKLYYSLVVSGE